MEINLILAIVLYIVLVVVLPSILVFVLINNKRLLKIFGIVFFILFLTVLSLLVFGNVVFKNGNIILSFSANAKWFSMLFLWGSFTKSNILLNLVMLFPVSLFVLSLNTKHSFIKTTVISFVISVVVELLQFVLPIERTTEVLDIVLNTISGMLGFGFYYLVFKFAKRYEVNLLNWNLL